MRLPSWGWHYEDGEADAKLAASLRAHGQLVPILVRDVDGELEIVDGRRRYTILGEEAVYVNLGPITENQARRIALTLELSAAIDYASLARQVKLLNAEPDFWNLATTTPFTVDRLGYFVRLCDFDWAQYEEAQGNLLDHLVAEEAAALMADVQVEEAEAAVVTAVISEAPPPPPKPAPPPPKPKPQPLPPPIAKRPTMSFEFDIPEAPVAPPVVVQTVARTVDPFVFDDYEDSAPIAASTKPAPIPPTSGGIVLFGELPTSSWVPKEPPSLDGITELSLDTETTGLRWHAGDRPIGISIHTPAGAQYLPFAHNGGGNLDEAVVKRWAQRELRGKHITGLNIKFDNHMLREWGVDLEEQGCTLGDVGHYAALLDDNRQKFSLEVLSQDYLGRGKVDAGLDKNRMADYHAGDVAEYAEEDARLVSELRAKMWPLMDAENLQRVRDLEDRLVFSVCEMERNGALLDVELLHQWTAETGKLVNDILGGVTFKVGFEVNPDKPQDWERLFDKLGIPVTVRTESGAPSFADSVLKSIDHPIVQAVRRAGRLVSIRSKYLLPYSEAVESSGLLRFNLHQLRADDHGTVSGRFSSSKVNIQQVMRISSQRAAFGYTEDDGSHDDEIFIIRKLFVPKAGFHLCSDARQIEYRLFAHYANTPKMLDAYKADPLTNYHKFVMALVEQYRQGFSYSSTKTLNFMKLYGGGKAHTAEMLDLPRRESDAFVDAYDRAFPEAGDLLKTVSRLAEQRGWVKTYLGRRARFKDRKWTHKALNRVIQGTAADVMKTKIIELHENRKHTGFLMRFTVHDEVDGDVPDAESTARVEEVLNRQSYEFRVPILWETGHGPNWAKAKS